MSFLNPSACTQYILVYSRLCCQYTRMGVSLFCGWIVCCTVCLRLFDCFFNITLTART